MVGSTVEENDARLPERGEVDDLAHEHAHQRGALEAADLLARRARRRAHSASSPVSSTNRSSRFVGPALAFGHVAVGALDAEHADRSAGAAGVVARGARLGLGLGEPRRRPVDLDRLAADVLAHELGRRPARDRGALGHDRHGVGEALGLLDVVRRHQDRDALGAQRVDQRPQLLAHLRVEADGRLVEQHEPRLVHERARDQQPPPHAARQLVGARVAAVAEARHLERALDRGLALGARDPVEVREHAQVLLDGQRRVEVVELRHDAHLGARRLRVAGERVAEHLDLALVGDRLRGQQPHRGALAGAVGPEQADAGALGHLEVEVVDRGDLAVALDDAAEAERDATRTPARGRRRRSRRPATMSARRPPRCTSPRSTPRSVSFASVLQGSHSSTPSHSTPPTREAAADERVEVDAAREHVAARRLVGELDAGVLAQPLERLGGDQRDALAGLRAWRPVVLALEPATRLGAHGRHRRGQLRRGSAAMAICSTVPSVLTQPAYRRRCGRPRPRRARANSASCAGSSSSVSACHCTASRNGCPGSSIPSIVPSGAQAVATRPSPSVSTAWWWKELTSAEWPPSSRAARELAAIRTECVGRHRELGLAVAVDVLVQRAAARDVERLGAAADAEQRHARRRRRRGRARARSGRARARSGRAPRGRARRRRPGRDRGRRRGRRRRAA